MKRRASDSDYLSKSDGTSWASCKAQTPVVGTSDLGDTDYLFTGKDYTAPTYHIWQTFLRFPTAAIRNSHEIDSATLRLYVETDGSDTDFTLTLIMLDATYGTVDASDWITTYTTYTTITVEDAAIETDANGDYIDIPFTAAMLALIPKTAGGTIDLALKANEVAEPTDGEYLKCYSHQYATEALRPRLDIVTTGLRQQLFNALNTTLDTIDEYDATLGYMTSPSISTDFKGMTGITSTDCPTIVILTDDEAREALSSYWVQDVGWHPYVLAVIHTTTPADIISDLNALIDDIEWCLGKNPNLGLSGGIQWVAINTVDTNESLGLGDNFGVAVLKLDVNYISHLNEP